MSVTIKCFGEGVRLLFCEVSTDVWQEWCVVKETNEVDWEQLLFNLSFLGKYGFGHWSELSRKEEQLIFLCNAQNIIEIKNGRKLLERFRSIELYGTNTLFPLYQTSNFDQKVEVQDGNVAFALSQLETGAFAKYLIPEHFEIAKLQFQLTQPVAMPDQMGISGLTYESRQLKSAGEDTVVRSSRVFLLNGTQ